MDPTGNYLLHLEGRLKSAENLWSVYGWHSVAVENQLKDLKPPSKKQSVRSLSCSIRNFLAALYNAPKMN